MSEQTPQAADPGKIPYIIYLTKAQLEYVTAIVAEPSMVGGADLIRRGILLETIQHAVPTVDYNNAIANRVVAAQKEAAIEYEKGKALATALEHARAEDERIAKEKELATPVAKPKSIVANTTATFTARSAASPAKAPVKKAPEKTVAKAPAKPAPKVKNRW